MTYMASIELAYTVDTERSEHNGYVNNDKLTLSENLEQSPKDKAVATGIKLPSTCQYHDPQMEFLCAHRDEYCRRCHTAIVVRGIIKNENKGVRAIRDTHRVNAPVLIA